MNKYKIFGWLIPITILFALSLVACGGDSSSSESQMAAAPTATTEHTSGDATHGEALFNQTCVACHGDGGIGVQGLGKDMTTSEFIGSTTDQELINFIKTGRPVSDPANTTNVDMPPKGGNPALSDTDLQDIVAYIRTLQQ